MFDLSQRLLSSFEPRWRLTIVQYLRLSMHHLFELICVPSLRGLHNKSSGGKVRVPLELRCVSRFQGNQWQKIESFGTGSISVQQCGRQSGAAAQFGPRSSQQPKLPHQVPTALQSKLCAELEPTEYHSQRKTTHHSQLS